MNDKTTGNNSPQNPSQFKGILLPVKRIYRYIIIERNKKTKYSRIILYTQKESNYSKIIIPFICFHINFY